MVFAVASSESLSQIGNRSRIGAMTTYVAGLLLGAAVLAQAQAPEPPPPAVKASQHGLG